MHLRYHIVVYPEGKEANNVGNTGDLMRALGEPSRLFRENHVEDVVLVAAYISGRSPVFEIAEFRKGVTQSFLGTPTDTLDLPKLQSMLPEIEKALQEAENTQV